MFDTHKLNQEGFDNMAAFKHTMADAVKRCAAAMPESREKSLYLTKLEEAVFFGAKAIASKPENHTEVIAY